MRCPSCGHENQPDRKFCGQCGAELAVACGACGAQPEPGERFCGQCGAPIEKAEAPAASAPAPAPQRAAGQPSSFSDGRYQVKGFLGEGGRKRVYLARDGRLDRDVAIAVIKTEGLDEAGLTRVRREAQAMGRLGDHPHIVTVYDIGEESGEPYIVSQHMAGGELASLIQEAPNQQLSIEDAMRFAGEIGDGLQHAHSRGIIHRDIKPGNIWLTEEGTAMIGDFGLAVALDRSRLTMAGMMVGTVGYMPPEQALGRDTDASSDLYSLGCVLYEMVTGRTPFTGQDSVSVISQHINTPPTAPSYHNSTVPRVLEALIMRLLAKSPDDRPASAADVVAELRRISGSTSVVTSVEQPLVLTGAGALQGVPWGRFAGRQEEMGQLKAVLETALAGQGAMVMLAGEPGIGKSRLAKEFTVYAGLRGAQILNGRCFESEASIPYHPFIQAIQQYVRTRPVEDLQKELGSDAPEIARMVSEVRQRIPDIAEVPPQEGETDRLRMFDSVCNFIRNAARANPVVLVLDDLQWADKSSLAMLRHVTRGIASDRVIILGCYRDVELEENHPLVEAIAELRREPFYQRIAVRGLPFDDVHALMSTLGEQQVPLEFVREVHRATEGNPLFIEEILRNLIEEGELVLEEGQWASKGGGLPAWDIPEGIRGIVKRRLGRLSDECLSILTPASAMPSGFTFGVLKEVTGEDEDRLLDLLDEALRAQVIRERKDADSRATGTYELSHTALRQTIYGELSAPRRVRLHRQLGEAIERVYESSLEPHMADLAYHFYRAAAEGDVDRAIDYGRRAGERAMALLAYEEAARSYRLALRAAELESGRGDDERCRLLLALGEAETRAGQGDQAVDVIEQALPLAERLDDVLATRAALAHDQAVRRSQYAYSGRSIPILRQALERLGEDDSPARARLLATLADLPPVGITMEEQIAIGREALAVAERVQDAEGVRASHQALLAALSGPEHLDERMTMARELISLGSKAGDRYAELWGHIRLMIALLSSGDVDGVDRELEIIYPRAADTREPAYIGRRPSWEGMRAAMEGEWDKAERHVQELLAAFQQVNVAWLYQAATALMYDIRRSQGRLDELEGPIRAALEQNPIPGWKAALTLLYCYQGRDADARELLEGFSEDDLRQIPQDWTFLITVCTLIMATRELADKERARVLYELLLPYRNQHVVVADAVVYLGSAVFNLGLSAAAMGDLDEAETLFKDAIDAERRCRARPFLARSQYEYAAMLVERGDPADQDKALGLANDALAAFQDMNMANDVDRALALKLRLLGIDSSEMGTSIEAVAAAVYVEQPDLRPHAAPDGTVTLLFSDIEGSTPMNERLGDQRWMEVLREHNGLIREEVRSNQGFEVKTEGDGFMIAFQSARQALQCAIAIQRAFAKRNDDTDEPVRVRMGLHTGEPVKEADDFYGNHVNLAARIASQASGGEILVSALLRELTESAGDISFGEERDVELKGLSGTQRVFSVEWK